YADAYTKGLHHAKLALCFLRKINRDRITQRTMEITASQRPMLAEKTDEHDAHFDDGTEYIGFSNDVELVDKARVLLADDARRLAIGRQGRKRCLSSGYSSHDRASEMIRVIQSRLRSGARG